MVVDEADLGGGAAHVEGEDAVEVERFGETAREDGAARGARLHQAIGKRAAVATSVRPPPEVIIRNGQPKPRSARAADRFVR